jgi:putative membrane protein
VQQSAAAASDPPAPPHRTPRGVRLRTVLGVLAGTALLALVLYHAGFAAVWDRLRSLGWWSPLILLPYAIISVFDAVGWRQTLDRAARRLVPFRALYLTRLAGEAVNSVTPTAALGGEPVKAWILRTWGVPSSAGMASVVIAKTALVASQSLFTAIGVGAILYRFDHVALAAGWLAVLGVGSIAFTLVLVWMQRRGPAAAVWRWLSRIAPRARFVTRLEHGATALDARLAEFYQMERTAFVGASLWFFAGWMAGVFEVHIMCALLGHPISWLDALVIETLAQPIRAAAIIVPGAIGTQELGGVWLCSLLGMPEPEAAALWVLKRARELVFDGVGLLYLGRIAGRGRALNPA